MSITDRFKHFLMTRYAVADRSGILGKRDLDTAWFARRFELFSRHTLPAVKAQTTQDFQWLLFFSLPFAPRLEALVNAIAGSDNTCLVPVIEGEWRDCDIEMRAAMRMFLGNETHVISTRIDSDDAIAPDFMELVQAQFKGQKKRTFLNFEHGFIKENGRTLSWDNRANMFQSVIEPASELQGIFTWHHGYTHQQGPVLQLQEPGRWTHIRHEFNSAAR